MGKAMPDPVKVSVIVAAYEAGDFIDKAIASCLAQSEANFEVIIVDDASKVSLAGAVARASGGDARVKFHRLESNSGPSGARNRALDAATGTFIAVLDADDAMRPDRLARMLAVAEMNGADIVVDNMIARRIDRQGRADETPFLNPQAIVDDLIIDLATYVDPTSNQRFGQPLGYLKPLVRRAALLDAGLRYDTDLTNSEDYYFIAELLARGAKMILTPYQGYEYTIQAGSISHRLSPAQAAAIQTAERAFQARWFGGASPALKRAGRRRLAQIRRDFQFETLIGDLKRKHLLAFAGHALAFLPNAHRHIGKFAAIAWNRLG